MLTHIEAVLPRIGQLRTTVEVTIQGMCFKDPREVIFYRPGIKAVSIESLPKLPQPIGLAHGGRIEEQVRCKFEIAPDCVPGEHPFRIRTATEITSLGTFHVSPFPVIDENEKGINTNDTLQTALPVTPNVTVRGRMGSSQPPGQTSTSTACRPSRGKGCRSKWTRCALLTPTTVAPSTTWPFAYWMRRAESWLPTMTIRCTCKTLSSP